MLVYVISKRARPLVPCNPQKARKLLKEQKAEVVKRIPFTIRLLYGSSGYVEVVSRSASVGKQNLLKDHHHYYVKGGRRHSSPR